MYRVECKFRSDEWELFQEYDDYGTARYGAFLCKAEWADRVRIIYPDGTEEEMESAE